MCAIKNAIYKYDYCGYGEYFPKTVNWRLYSIVGGVSIF